MSRKLPDWIDSFLELTDNSEPPHSYRLWTAISVLAAVMKRKCKFNWGPLVFYPNMYIILVGPAGRCRKGTAMSVGQKFLTELGIKVAAEAVTREALIRELKSSIENTMMPDGTISLDSSLTVFSKELTVFLGVNNAQMLSDLTDWFDCADKWVYRTKTQGTDEIMGVWVNLIGATTPELIQTALPRDAIGGGLTSRMIFVYAEKRGKLVPAPFITPKEAELWGQLRQDLDHILLLKGEFKATPKFVDRYIEWYIYQANNPPFKSEVFSGYIERRATHLLKLCMILSASRGDSMIIDVEDLERASTFLEDVEKTMPRVFSGVGKSDLASTVSRVLVMLETKKSATLAELCERFHQDADYDTMQRVIATLEGMGAIVVSIKGPGSVGKIISMNPEFCLKS